MKRLLNLTLLVLLFGFVFGFTYGDNIPNPDAITGDNISGDVSLDCMQDKYEIIGAFQVKKDIPNEYSIKLKEDIGYSFSKTIVYSLYTGEKLLQTFTGDKFDYTFANTGDYQLNVDIVEESGCIYLIKKNIKVYKDIYLYISDTDDNSRGLFEDNFDRNEIFLKKIVLYSQSFFSEIEFLKQITENIYYVKNSTELIIDTDNFGVFFESLGKIVNLYNVNLASKQIFVVTDTNQNFLRRLLARYMKLIGVNKLYVLENSNLLNLLSDLSFGEDIIQKEYLNSFSVSFQGSSNYFFISAIIDYLIYNGFPTNLLILLLSIAVSALIVSTFRQIIGLSVFSVYNPLLFAVSMVVLGIKFSFILLFIAFVATLITRIFTQKIYLLHSAKMSMLIILYFIVTIFILWIDKFFGFSWIDYSIFQDALICFPILFLIIVADKVFYEGFSLLKRGWWISFSEFLIVSFVVYAVLTWDSFKNLLLSYPEILLLILVLNIFVGRFTGLQLLEYIRFMPLIKKQFDEEEE